MPQLLVAAVAALALLLASPPKPTVDRFDEHAAWSWLVRQVQLGPRPAGSVASRRLAEQLRGAKEVPGFLGANDGAGGTAVALQLARTIKPRQLRPSVLFLFFDGEEAPGGADGSVLESGLRGSRFAALLYTKAEAMILLDFVADRDLAIPREQSSDAALWARLRAAAVRVGEASVFPNRTVGAVVDDHLPFAHEGVPAIDLIDFTFSCWHRTCDDLTAVSMRSLDAVGETVYELLRSL
jgi:Zn-dependent M28 family amino/carboxypeptidase